MATRKIGGNSGGPKAPDVADIVAGPRGQEVFLAMVDAAGLEDPEPIIGRAGRGRAADVGLAALAGATAAIRAAPADAPAPERARLLGPLTEPSTVWRLAWAQLVKPAELLRGMIELRAALGGASASVDGFESLIKQTAKRYASAAQLEDAERQMESRRSPAHAPLPEGHALHDDAATPDGWRLDGDGIHRRVQKGESVSDVRVSHRPIWIDASFRDADTGESRLGVRWHDGLAWRSRVVSRHDLMVGRRVAELAQWGLPVHSGTAGDLAAWFAAYEARNVRATPTSETTGSLGWRAATDAAEPHAFVLGSSILAAGGADVPGFLPPEGAAQALAGYRARGSWSAWCAALESVADRPLLHLAVLASLAAPLLRLIPAAPNFVLDYAGLTSQGKTTALRLAASVWGDPSERDGGILRTWDASPTFIERIGGIQPDLPLILDDSKRADPRSVSRVVYAVAQGLGRGRGTVAGVQRTATWRTVLISSGEAPITSYTRDGGASARVLSLWGSPLGGPSEANGDLARATIAALHDHHGHAGPRAVRWLLGLEPEHGTQPWASGPGAGPLSSAPAGGRIAALRARWRDVASRAGQTVRNKPLTAVAGRALDYVATLHVALDLAAAIGVPAPRGDDHPLDAAWSAVGDASASSDSPAGALRVASEWAGAHPDRFFGHADAPDGRPVSAGWAGAWRVPAMPGSPPWEYLDYLPETLRAVLDEAGYKDTEAIRRAWRDLGWTDCAGGEGKTTATTKIGGTVCRVVRIKREAIERGGQ